jgi:hypothetical protein
MIAKGVDGPEVFQVIGAAVLEGNDMIDGHKLLGSSVV